MLKSTLKLFSLIFFLLTITLYSSKIIYAAEYLPIPTNTKFSLEIDREELALPAEYGKYLDTAFHTLSINNEIKGYIAGIVGGTPYTKQTVSNKMR